MVKLVPCWMRLMHEPSGIELAPDNVSPSCGALEQSRRDFQESELEVLVRREPRSLAARGVVCSASICPRLKADTRVHRPPMHLDLQVLLEILRPSLRPERVRFAGTVAAFDARQPHESMARRRILARC